MKKLFVVFLSVLLCLQVGLCVCAVDYEMDLYTVQLPDDYDWVKEDSFISDNGSNFSVSYSDNTKEKACIADMSKKDIEEYASEIETMSAAAMSVVGKDGKIEVISSEKVEHPNGKTALVTVFKTSAKSDDGDTVKYQKRYEFTCVEKSYKFTYTAAKKEYIDDLDDAFDTIVINEAEIESRQDKMGSIGLFCVLAILILLGIIRFIAPTPSKKQKKKTK